MNTLKKLSTILLSVLLLGSCTSDDVIQDTARTDAAPSIHFRLGGSAKVKTSASRAATIAAEDNERAVNTLHALLFDTHKGFVGVEEARPTGPEGEYDVLVREDATYDIWFVANADENLLTLLKAIPDTTSARYATQYMQTIFATQAPEGTENGFLMRSASLKRVTTTLTKTEDLGEVAMTRMAARFDIVNRAEGVTVTEITFKNRAVKTALYKPNWMPEEVDGWFDTKTYTPAGLTGNKDPEQATAYRHEIYSYRNTSLEEDSVPVMTLKYTETDSEGNTVTRTHDVKFINPNAPAGTPLAINANYLYTITLTKAYKLEFNLTVEDWNEAETFNVTELPVQLDPDTQDALNKQLLVYDLFADYNVKSLNLTNKTAEFFTELHPANEYDKESYFTWNTMNSNGFCGNNEKSYIYVDSQPYQIPTLGHAMLLSPLKSGPEGFDETLGAPRPNFFKTSNMYTATFKEDVYIEPTLKSDETHDEGIAFSGTSQLMIGSEGYQVGTKKITHNGKVITIGCSVDDPEAELSFIYPCYGLRFKGSEQCAAYKWRSYITDDGKTFYTSIQIKALPNKGEGFEVYDIADNITFWKEGTYIEIKFPYTGNFISPTASLGGSANSYILLKTVNENYGNSEKVYFWSTSLSQTSIDRSGVNAAFPLRLVKVKQTTENE